MESDEDGAIQVNMMFIILADREGERKKGEKRTVTQALSETREIERQDH